jgi:hypothetical protein
VTLRSSARPRHGVHEQEQRSTLDRDPALTRTNVEGPARGEAGDLGDKPPVWAPAPHRPVALAVPRVPLGGLRHRAEPLLAVFVHARHYGARWDYGARWATGVPVPPERARGSADMCASSGQYDDVLCTAFYALPNELAHRGAR